MRYRIRRRAPVAIAEVAIHNANFAIALCCAAMHKDQAFQASSPKNFHGRSCTGLFFRPRSAYTSGAVVKPNDK
jgi:hypothetical protein